MIKATDFLGPAVERGYTFWTGVPCSYLTPFINAVIVSPNLTYIGAASEGEAVGIAAGAYLAGRKTVVICQNSGLGNTVNPLTSLNFPFRIPTLLVVTHRGEPGVKDEPQHELMGRITERLLDTLEIPHEPFPREPDDVVRALARAEDAIATTCLPFAFVMKKGAVEETALEGDHRRPLPVPSNPYGRFILSRSNRMPRLRAISVVRESVSSEAALIATTGKIGRELSAIGHRSSQLYVVGSMGCASGIGLGIHEARGGDRPVVVLDGDGAALMKLGTLATIGYRAPIRLTHVLLDNEAHESTGAQETVSSAIDFGAIASACGYRRIHRVEAEEDLSRAVKECASAEGPSFIHCKVAIGSDPNLPRPDRKPVEVKQEFMEWIRV